MRMNDEPPQAADHAALAELRREIRGFLGLGEAAARVHGLTPRQYQVLLEVAGAPRREGVDLGELAMRMRAGRSRAAKWVSLVEARQLVKRVTLGGDRRRSRVALTAKGRKLIEKLYRAQRDELRLLGARLAALRRDPMVRVPARIPLASPACFMPEIED